MAVTDHIPVYATLVAIAFVAGGWALPSVAWADDVDGRATLQERYGSKAAQPYGHAGGTAMIRDDFYRTFGVGLDVGYFFNEDWGIELRAHHHITSLSHTGQQMAEDHQLVPDMRAPDATLAAGARLSWGYGKLLTLGDFVVHFDPQVVTHAGLTFAEERYVPMAAVGIGFLTHWQYGIQIKLDLQATFHGERRDRGPVVATGFAPVLKIGWSPDWGGD